MYEFLMVYWFISGIIAGDLLFERWASFLVPKYRVDRVVVPFVGIIFAVFIHSMWNWPERGFGVDYMITMFSILIIGFWLSMILNSYCGKLMFLRKRVILADGKAYLSSGIFNRKVALWFTNEKRHCKVDSDAANLLMQQKRLIKQEKYTKIIEEHNMRTFACTTAVANELSERQKIQELLNDHKGYYFNV